MSKIIILNVGGIKYTTTITTLSSEQGSMLERMFNGKLQSIQEEDGSYFIDSDGEIFKYILEYLRYRTITIEELSGRTISLINKSLDYFSINYKINMRNIYPMIETKNLSLGNINFIANDNDYILDFIHRNMFNNILDNYSTVIFFKYRCKILYYNYNSVNNSYNITIQSDFNKLTDIMITTKLVPEYIRQFNELFEHYWI